MHVRFSSCVRGRLFTTFSKRNDDTSNGHPLWGQWLLPQSVFSGPERRNIARNTKFAQIASSFIDEPLVAFVNDVNMRVRCITQGMIRSRLMKKSQAKEMEELSSYLVRVEGTLGELTVSFGVFRPHQRSLGNTVDDVSFRRASAEAHRRRRQQRWCAHE